MSVVHEAVYNFELERVKMFVENRGFDVNSRDHDGCTLLFYAISCRRDINCKLIMMEYLLRNGVDVNATAKTGATALHIASASGELEIVAFLLENGADPYAQDNKGQIPLHYACARADLST